MDGTIKLCCQGPQLRDGHGEPLTVYQQTLDEIWNSDDMQSIRRAMVAGDRVEGCRKCWQVEDRAGISKRMEANDVFLMGGRSITHLSSDAHRQGYRCQSLPSDYQLDLGNTCNLKCRTCLGQYSSRIAADPIHQLWERAESHNIEEANIQSKSSMQIRGKDYAEHSRFPSKLPWYEEHDFLIGELLAHPREITVLQIIGGEPLVVRQLGPIIEHMAKEGVPEQVTLSLTTNGTIFDSALFDTLKRFRKVVVSVSIDGLGDHFEYIRYPGKWGVVLDNLDSYERLGNVKLYVLPTFHIYNALNITDLFRFCDDRRLRMIFNTLWTPRHLAASVLPPKARQVAIARLRGYAQSTRVRFHSQLAKTLARELEEKGNTIDKDLIRKFMLFTNDLDSTRQERFKDIYGEMISLMVEDGIAWTSETLHAEMEGGS